jgi:hypothetical protein
MTINAAGSYAYGSMAAALMKMSPLWRRVMVVHTFVL